MLIRAHEEAGRTRKMCHHFPDKETEGQGWQGTGPRLRPKIPCGQGPLLSFSLPCSTCSPGGLRTVAGSRWEAGSGTRGLSRSKAFPPLISTICTDGHTHTLWLSDSYSSLTPQLQHHFPERQYLAPRLVRPLYYVFCVNLSCFFTSIYHYKYMYLNDYIISV